MPRPQGAPSSAYGLRLQAAWSHTTGEPVLPLRSSPFLQFYDGLPPRLRQRHSADRLGESAPWYQGALAALARPVHGRFVLGRPLLVDLGH
jgi:hypothetical protein